MLVWWTGNMHSDEYSRLRAACVAMAEQGGLPDARARWLKLAETCFSLAKDLPDDRRGRERARPAPRSGPGSIALPAA
jgi:hypothetical protein